MAHPESAYKSDKFKDILIVPEAFKKNDDGTWTSLQTTFVNSPVGEVRIKPGMTFKPGRTFIGVDVVALLEKN